MKAIEIKEPAKAEKIRLEDLEVAEYELKDLWPVAMLFIVVGVGVTYGLSVQTDVQADFTAGTAAYNASQDSINAVAKIPQKSGTLVTIVIASIIISTVAGFFYMRSRG